MSMFMKVSLRPLRFSGRPSFSTVARLCREHEYERSSVHKVDYATKYAEKLQRRAEEHGVTVEQLQEQIREKEKKERQVRKSKLERASPTKDRAYASVDTPIDADLETFTSTSSTVAAARKDSSPVKPLSSILNLERLLQTPHTPEQVSLLWQAYHASRSGGTGRGHLCATIPVATYHKMLEVASQYPSFVIPVPRENAQVTPQGELGQPTEFFYLEWGFHGSPPEVDISNDPFNLPKPSTNPHTSTVLFTPLQEYKVRNSFATPYLVLTHYTDLANSHGLVLLRGEITPSAANTELSQGDGRYLLGQQDAQLLAMAVQRFYLWNEGKNERGELLRRFHEQPEGFKWEDLMKQADISH